MFKKTIIASALAMAALSSQAAVVAITGTNVSLEGSAGATSIPVPNAVVTLGAEYTVNDEITFTVTGAEFDATSAPALAASLAGGDTATFGFLSQTANTVKFRITAQTDGGTDGVNYTGGTFTLSGMTLKTSTVLDTTGDISVAYSAVTGVSGTAIDNVGTLTDVSNTVVAQLSSSTTTSLDGIIDVEKDRQEFTTGTTDALTVTTVEAVAAVNDAVYDGATYVINGDFSWMETDGDAGIDAAELTAAFGVTTTGDDTFASVINADASAITVTATDAGADAVDVTTFTFTVAGQGAGNATLAVQDFTVDTTINYTTAAAAAATKATQAGAEAGSWTLNGAQAFFNYVPVGFSGMQSNIILSNKSTKAGGVIVEAFDANGNTYGPMTMATELAGETNMRVAGTDLMSLLSAPAGTKLSVTITVNAPDASIDFSGYTQKAGTGRQAMPVKYL